MAFTTVTLADLVVHLRASWDGVAFFTDTEARLAINEALREWNLWTGRWRRRVLLAAVASQHEYLLPATLTYGMAVRYVTRALHPSAIVDLDLGRPTWRGETTTTGGAVPPTPTVWVPIALQQIAVWPAPAVDLADAIVVDGVSATPILIEDADTADLDDAHLDVLLDFALHVATFKQGGPAWQATLPAWQALLQAAAEENGRLKANQKFRRMAGLPYRGLQPATGTPTQMDAIAQAGGPS